MRKIQSVYTGQTTVGDNIGFDKTSNFELHLSISKMDSGVKKVVRKQWRKLVTIRYAKAMSVFFKFLCIAR